jgi:hypothetical protein
MKRVRYTKFTGDLSSSFGLEDLMQALSDFFLDSGFNDPYSAFQEFNEQTLENLRDARRRPDRRTHRQDHPEDAGAELHQRRAAPAGPGSDG